MATYKPKIYKTSGGDEQVVDDDGVLTVHSGGLVHVDAGAGVQINDVDYLTTGGYVADPRLWEETLTTEGAMANYGVSVLNPAVAGAANKNFTVEPALGRIKYIVCISSTSTSATVAQTTGTWDGTNKNAIFSSGSAYNEGLIAIGVSTSRWALISLSTAITFSNT